MLLLMLNYYWFILPETRSKLEDNGRKWLGLRLKQNPTELTTNLRLMIFMLIFFWFLGEANGLCHVLTVACPKPRPTMWDLSPQTRDKWEIDRAELEFIRKLGSGNFGEVWYGKFWNRKSKNKLERSSFWRKCLKSTVISFVYRQVAPRLRRRNQDPQSRYHVFLGLPPGGGYYEEIPAPSPSGPLRRLFQRRAHLHRDRIYDEGQPPGTITQGRRQGLVLHGTGLYRGPGWL